jgi:cubilin
MFGLTVVLRCVCVVLRAVPCTDYTPQASNGWATFSCGACPSGYVASASGCSDVNECQTANGGCSTAPAVQCYNTIGGSYCAAGVNCTGLGGSGTGACSACPIGYTGDGKVCTDVNECATNNGGWCVPRSDFRLLLVACVCDR